MDRPYLIKWPAGEIELRAGSEEEARRIATQYVLFKALLKAQAVYEVHCDQREPKE